MRNAKIAMGEERIKIMIRPKGKDAAVELEITDRDAAAANRALELLAKADEVRLFSEQPAKDDGVTPRQDVPRDTGQDHLAALAQRYGNGLRLIQGGQAVPEKSMYGRTDWRPSMKRQDDPTQPPVQGEGSE